MKKDLYGLSEDSQAKLDAFRKNYKTLKGMNPESITKELSKALLLEEEDAIRADNRALGEEKANIVEDYESIEENMEKVAELKVKLGEEDAIERKEQIEAEYLKDAPYVAQKFYKAANENTQKWMREHVEYKGEDIIFRVEVLNVIEEYVFAKENVKLNDVTEQGKEKVKNERVKLSDGREIDECFIEWNYMNDEYLKKGKQERDYIKTDLGYIRSVELYYDLVRMLPREHSRYAGYNIQAKSLFAMLGGESTGLRFGDKTGEGIGEVGYFWFIDHNSVTTSQSWCLESYDDTLGIITEINNSKLLPVRVLRKPPRILKVLW